MPHPLTTREADHILDISYETICTYFRRLSSANFVTKTRSGYILTQYGSQLLLLMDAPPDPERLKNAEIWHIFSRYGIGRNARTKKLASQPYLTPEYID